MANQNAKDVALAQGVEPVLQTILQQIQTMMQAADTSLQGTLQSFSSINETVFPKEPSMRQ